MERVSFFIYSFITCAEMKSVARACIFESCSYILTAVETLINASTEMYLPVLKPSC